MKSYRIVVDFGYGDRTWTERMIPEDQVLALINLNCNVAFESIDQAMDHDTFFIELDSWDDEEDWDWMDS